MCLMYKCFFRRINLQQKHPHSWKTWDTAILFFNSLLLKLRRRCYVITERRIQPLNGLILLELHSSEAEFDTSCALWTGSFWCIASVNKSLCWFRRGIWPMHKKKDNGERIWQCLQIPQNLQWLLQHSNTSNEGIREQRSGCWCPCFVCTFLTEHPCSWGWLSKIKFSLQLRQ